MAFLDISEYTRLARDSQANVIPTGVEPARVQQQVAIGAASAQSAAFDSATTFVRVHTDTPARIAFGVNPTATSASMRMSPGATEYFEVRYGHKVAVIATA